MKTKRTSLAPMAVTSLMGLVPKNETQQDITYSGTTSVVRKEVVLLEKKIIIGANVLSILKALYYFYFLFVSSLSTSTPKNRLVFYRYFCTQYC